MRLTKEINIVVKRILRYLERVFFAGEYNDKGSSDFDDLGYIPTEYKIKFAEMPNRDKIKIVRKINDSNSREVS